MECELQKLKLLLYEQSVQGPCSTCLQPAGGADRLETGGPIYGALT